MNEKNNKENKNEIKIRLNLDENDPLYKKFNDIKERTGINANTEVLRYSIKKTYDIEIKTASISGGN